MENFFIRYALSFQWDKTEEFLLRGRFRITHSRIRIKIGCVEISTETQKTPLRFRLPMPICNTNYEHETGAVSESVSVLIQIDVRRQHMTKLISSFYIVVMLMEILSTKTVSTAKPILLTTALLFNSLIYTDLNIIFGKNSVAAAVHRWMMLFSIHICTSSGDRSLNPFKPIVCSHSLSDSMSVWAVGVIHVFFHTKTIIITGFWTHEYRAKQRGRGRPAAPDFWWFGDAQ